MIYRKYFFIILVLSLIVWIFTIVVSTKSSQENKNTQVGNVTETTHAKLPIATTTSASKNKTSTTTKSVVPKKIIPSKSTSVLTPAIPPAQSTPPSSFPTPPPPKPPADFEQINQSARKAIVNILCTDQKGEEVTGTGIVVGSQGIILTNAHIGQFFLIRDYPVKNYMSCIIRTGSPAYPTYTAELVYISPTWVADNKTILTDTNPKGTGENDFAFLRITGKIDGSTIYVTGLPCPSCMIRIVRKQIHRVVYMDRDYDSGSSLVNDELIQKALQIAKDGFVKVEKFKGNINWLKDWLLYLTSLGVFK